MTQVDVTKNVAVFYQYHVRVLSEILLIFRYVNCTGARLLSVLAMESFLKIIQIPL